MSKTTKQKIVTFIVMLLLGAVIGFAIHVVFLWLRQGISTGSSRYYTLKTLPKMVLSLITLIVIILYARTLPASDKKTWRDRIRAIFFPCALPFIMGSVAVSQVLYKILVIIPTLDSLYDKLIGMG